MDSTPNKQSEFNIATEARYLDALISQWDEDDKVKIRREARKKEYNVNEMRTKGEIEANETYVARRIIDRNIAREKPEFLNYLESSPRLVLFKSKSDPSKETTALANWFSLGMKYEGWNEPWHRTFDAVRLHGAAFIELKPSKTAPFNLELEYTPREFLIFPIKLRRSIQKCERILRKYEYLPHELEQGVKTNGFNAKVVEELTKTSKDTNRDDPICVYKAFLKKDGIIYTAWYSENAKSQWLKDPAPLDLGQVAIGADGIPVSVPSTRFPFACVLFEYTEEEEILNCKGRASRDLADQDALSSIWSGVVNGILRASRLQASRVNAANAEGAQTEPIEDSKIMPYEVNYFQAAYPDAMMLQVAQQLGVENMQGAGQVDYAVSNRKDSRKTATELQLAQQQAGQLSSVTITPCGNGIVEIYSMAWEIVQSQVVVSYPSQDNPKPVGIFINPPANIPLEDFTDNYILAPAGDIEVVKRAEKIQSLQQDLALFAGTPAYPILLSKYIELRFPDEAAQIIPSLQAPDLTPVVAQLLSILQAVPTDGLTPEQQTALQNIMQNAQSTLTQAAGVSGGAQPMAPGRNDNATPSGSPPQASQPARAGSRQT